jgi:hypothetical protein
MKVARFYVFIFIFFNLFKSEGQNFEWVKNLEFYNNVVSNNESVGQSISRDSQGNVYVAGYNSLNAYSLVKLDSTGTSIIWQKNYVPSSMNYNIINIEIDANNNIIVQLDNLLKKYDSNGNIIWEITNCTGSGIAKTFKFNLDPSGNIYLVGTFNGSIDFNPGSGVTNQSAQGNSEQIFVQKIAASGGFVSVYRTFDEYIGGLEPYKPFSAKIFDIKFDSGKVFVLGNTTGSFGIKFTNTSVLYGPFLLSLNNNCSLNYVNRVSVNSLDFLDAKLLSNSNGTVSVFAKLDGSQATAIDFDPGPSQAFISVSATNGRIVKADYNSLSGNFVNVNVILESWANRILDFSIDKDMFNNFYITGTFSATVDFNPNPNITNNLSAAYYQSGSIPISGYDIFFAKYNSNVTLINVNQIGSYGSDFSKDIFIQSNNCYITGSVDITYPVDFDFDAMNTYEVLAPPCAYVLKLNLCPGNFVNAGNDQTICQGQSITLNASGATTYSWNNSVTNNSAFTPTATNTYVVVGTDANGCQDSDTVNVTVNQNTSSTINQTANNTYTFNGQIYTQSGTYTQVIPNANGCDSTITLNLTINNIGLDEVGNSAISIYPNPATNQITIAYAGQIQKVEILDAKGAIVYSSIENKKEIILPSNMQSGYYLVLVHTADGVFRKELVVNR